MRNKNNKWVVGCYVMTFVLSCVLAGCGAKGDAVSQKMIDDISALGEITLDDEDEINKLIDRYSTLTDEQKNAVNNYAALLDAQDKIEEIKNTENEALLGEEAMQAVLAVVRNLKNGLKHPDSLVLYGVSYLEGRVDGIDNDVILVLVDYEAANDVGGTIRHTDSIGVGGFSDGSSLFYNRDDGELGDSDYISYLIYHNAWLKYKNNNPDAAIDVDTTFVMNNL